MAKYEVKDLIDTARLRDDLAVNQNDLSISMMSQAGLFAYYASLAAQAQLQQDKLEQMEEIVLARLDRKVRDGAAASGTKMTEAQVKAQIALEPDAIAIKTAVNRARMVASLCKMATESFRHRRDMMIQMAFNDREERKGELRVFEERQQAGRELRQQRVENILNR